MQRQIKENAHKQIPTHTLALQTVYSSSSCHGSFSGSICAERSTLVFDAALTLCVPEAAARRRSHCSLISARRRSRCSIVSQPVSLENLEIATLSCLPMSEPKPVIGRMFPIFSLVCCKALLAPFQFYSII